MSRLSLRPDEFHRLALRVSEFATQYLERLPSLPTFPLGVTGDSVQQRLATALPEDGLGEQAFDGLAEVFALSRPNSPGFLGYVFGSGEPVAAVGDFAASVLNQNVVAWRSAPAAVAIERTVVSWLAEAIGCKGLHGSLCGGGSLANLMGLCMAREAKAPANEDGAQAGTIYTSTASHMSMPRAAALLGLGRRAVRYVEVDEAFRLKPDALAAAIERDRSAGKKPIAVVASAGTIATGSIDPLDAVAEVCKRHDLWLHVDGAYGALAAIADPEKFKGLSRADSISLDPHKWLYQPADCSCILFRDDRAARRAFSHTADYVQPFATDPIEGFAFFDESIEQSRRFRALKLWLSLRYHGLRAFREAIAEDIRLAQVLAGEIDKTPQLERLAPVELSAVCFRFKAKEDIDAANRAILNRVVQRGRVYISNATLLGNFALRACVVNHRCTETDVKAVVSEVCAAAEDLKLRASA